MLIHVRGGGARKQEPVPWLLEVLDKSEKGGVGRGPTLECLKVGPRPTCHRNDVIPKNSRVPRPTQRGDLMSREKESLGADGQQQM